MMRVQVELAAVSKRCHGKAAVWVGGSLLVQAALGLSPAWAQSAAATDPSGPQAEAFVAGGDEIVVTARKREESAISVPVVVTAMGSQEIQRRAINNIDLIARAVPGLITGEGGGTIQGGTIAIRGLSSPDTNGLGEQAVSFNIDGVQISRAGPRRLSSMDLAQVEILKGPQALFFGKNSPAGVISIRTADPTQDLSAKLQAGYEFVGHEIRAEGYVAGPISDNLGFRVAGYVSHVRGWAKNLVPATSPFASSNYWGPRSKEQAGRVTLKYDDQSGLTNRFKFNLSRLKGDSPTFNQQRVNCPLGRPQPISFPSLDNCKADNITYTGEIGPSFQARYAPFGVGKTSSYQRQILTSNELNYDIDEDIRFTSVTGYYNTKQDYFFNSTLGYAPAVIQPTRFFLKIRELGQEFRLASSFDGPLNFVFGAYGQRMRGFVDATAYFNANTPTVATIYRYRQRGSALSGFGQIMWDIVPTLEFSAGGRYSYEKKSIPLAATGTNASPGPNVVVPSVSSVKYNDFSPEMTLTYRPSQRLTVFGSYKRGFLSGGFNTGSQNVTSGFVYRPETIKGFEGGVKASLLDGRLRTNFSAYDYKVSNLQVTVTVDVRAELRNAASVRMKGAEWDFSYRTPIDGLSINGAVAYNHARYGSYLASCYAGQPQPGCALRPSPFIPGTNSLSQVLDGAQVDRAPSWSGNLGMLYETPVSAGYKIGLGGNMTFTSGYFTSVTNKPAGRQRAYQLFDATVRLATTDDKYEIALLGRNLTKKYYFVRNNDVPFTGAGTGGVAGTTTLADTGAPISRGREIMLRLTAGF
ncbi:TonB-dependent receptor [Rhizorhabdus sp.]|uniref:TonB-dependent receptor n=1 Tax=Rhizorhabdus sp. TaxID=1968843 RepID=UPI0019BD2E8E|nr:TonB-dependent receptor [Rhizorhabdus sp.]MBD3761660.1 TonB-dependent receptor [Rhizorhabdus sp.]